MTYAMNVCSRLVHDERGTEVIEYALLLGMIACACIGLLTVLGEKVVGRWARINEMIYLG